MLLLDIIAGSHWPQENIFDPSIYSKPPCVDTFSNIVEGHMNS